MNFFIVKQLPVLPPETYTPTHIHFIAPRVLELTYTAHDLQPFAADLWAGDSQPTPAPATALLTSSTQQLSLGIAPTPPQQQLELAPTPDPQQQLHLRQRFIDQWRANWQATALTLPPPLPEGEEEQETPQNPSLLERGAGEMANLDPTCEQLSLPPFIWNETRRAQIRAELDAYYAHLYGLTRDELRYILDPADIHGPDFPSETFRVLKNKEIKQFGEYRTQRLVLAAWDRLFGGSG